MASLKLVEVEQSWPLDTTLDADLRRIEDEVRAGDRASIEARWRFGRRLLRRKGDAKQLPNGLREAIIEEHGISRSELAYRLKFAEKYETKEEVSTVVDTYKSWTAIRENALYEKREIAQPSADLVDELSELLDAEGQTSFDTREGWLQAVVSEVRPLFGGAQLPEKVHVSVAETPGQMEAYCTTARRSEDGTSHIFLGAHLEAGEDVAAILVHELCHAALPDDVQHGREFKVLAQSVGLEGPMKSTIPGEQLKERLREIVDKIGEYPHVPLKKRRRLRTPRRSSFPELWTESDWYRFSTEVDAAALKLCDALVYWRDPNLPCKPGLVTKHYLSMLHESLEDEDWSGVL